MNPKSNDAGAKPARQQNEGEGSVTADRRYRAGVERTVQQCDTDELGKEAAKALDGPEGAELREAEAAAKGGRSGERDSSPSTDRLGTGSIASEKDQGYGKSHGYGPSHGGPTGPGDAPARPARPRL